MYPVQYAISVRRQVTSKHHVIRESVAVVVEKGHDGDGCPSKKFSKNKKFGQIELCESWHPRQFLVDSGAEISIISTNKAVIEDGSCTSVQGIGGRQLIGPKKK